MGVSHSCENIEIPHFKDSNDLSNEIYSQSPSFHRLSGKYIYGFYLKFGLPPFRQFRRRLKIQARNHTALLLGIQLH